MHTLFTLLAAVLVAETAPAPRQPAENEERGMQSDPGRRDKPSQPYGSPPLPHDRRMPTKQWA